MINKITLFALVFALCASVSTAQTTGERHKFEVSAGYSNNQVDSGVSDDEEDFEDFFEDRESFNGFSASAVGNFSRYVGAKGEITGHYKNFDFTVPASGTTGSQNFEVKSSLYNFLGGVQVKDNAVEGSRFRPFAHALVGVARGKSSIEGGSFSSAGLDETEYGFAAAIGGGIDIKASKRISIRAFQFDYNPTRLNDSTQQNFRFGAGIVIH